jgi:hypothetical protein
MGAVAATITWFGCRRENKKRDKARLQMPEVLDQSMELGDE